MAYQHPNIKFTPPKDSRPTKHIPYLQKTNIIAVTNSSRQTENKTRNWTRGSNTRRLGSMLIEHRNNNLREPSTPATQSTEGEPETKQVKELQKQAKLAHKMIATTTKRPTTSQASTLASAYKRELLPSRSHRLLAPRTTKTELHEEKGLMLVRGH
jgi:hypothetical protein